MRIASTKADLNQPFYGANMLCGNTYGAMLQKVTVKCGSDGNR